MKYTTARAFAPANISCVFKIHSHINPRWEGSSGFGFTLDEGVTAAVQKFSKTEMLFNKKPIDFPTVKSVLAQLGAQPLKVMLESGLPLGCGFGISGASALATAYAVNTLLGLGKTKKELAIVAHIAEVENKTGLGDVVNQYFGGFLVKLVPSSQFIVTQLPFENVPVYCASFGSIATKSVLTNATMKEQINSAAAKALDKIERAKTFLDAILIAKEFSQGSGLLKDSKAKTTISSIEEKGGHASMIMIGNAVFSDIPFEGARQLTITKKGAHLL